MKVVGVLVRTGVTSVPKPSGPRAGTIFPCKAESVFEAGQRKVPRPTRTLPWKIKGSLPGPAQYAKVQMASARLSSYAASRLLRPS